MSKYVLSQRSIDRLEGVHRDLVSVIKLAIQFTSIDFTVIEGLRSKERQVELMAQSKKVTTTLKSRHIYGFAVDLGAYVDGHILYKPSMLYSKIALAMKRAAIQLKIPIVWGGDWKGAAGKLQDLGHFELSKKFYPDPREETALETH